MRPSFDLLMQAQEKLGDARDAEAAAGNRGVAMVLNRLVLSVFQLAMDTEIDEVANAACDKQYPGPTP